MKSKLSIFKGHLVLSACLFTQTIIYAQIGGSIDPTFANNGTHLLDISQLDDGFIFNDMKVGPNNKIVYVGYTSGGDNINMTIACLNADGTLDNGFGTNGLAMYDPTLGGNNTLLGVAIQPDGKILATGRTSVGLNSTLFVGRFLTDGSFDPSFGGGDGYVEYPSFTGERIAMDNNGKIVVMGYIVINGVGLTTVYRLNSDGTKDNSFSGDGYIQFHLPDDPQINGEQEDISVAPDNSVYIVGRDYASNAIVCKLTPAGELDNNFSGDGRVKISHQLGGEIYGVDVVNDANGKLFVLAKSVYNNESSIMVSKFNVNGTIDNTFGNQGITNLYPQAGFTISAVGIIHNANGIYISGQYADNNNSSVFTANFNEAGNLNTSYGNNGIALIDPNPNISSYAISIDSQSDGKVIVGGYGSEDNKYYPWVSRLNKAGFMSVSEMELPTISVYPNPTSESFQINTENNVAVENVSLLSMSGNEIQTWNVINGQYDLPSNLSNGMYVLRIQVGNKISHQLLNVSR